MITRTLTDGRVVQARHNHGLRKRCACPRSTWVRCTHPWHANFSHQGVEHRVSLHKWAKKPAAYVMLQGEAKTLYRDWVASIEGGQEPTAKSDLTTLDMLATLYLAEYVQHPDRRKTAAAQMTWQVNTLATAVVTLPTGATVTLGTLALTAITKPVIEAFRVARRQAHEQAAALATQTEIPADQRKRVRVAAISTKAGRVSTNRLLARLRHLFSWAIAEKGILDASPFSKGGVTVIKLDQKAEGPRSRRLEGDEEARLLKAAGGHLRACIECALETGMRKSEILGLKWGHVRESVGVLDLPATLTKTGTARQVVITPRLSAILSMRATAQRVARDLKDDETLPLETHPFGNEIGEHIQSVKTAWRLTCQRADITGLTFHDLRREAGSRLLETPGVSLTDVRDYLGHKSATMTNTYLASTTLRLRDALKKRDTARTFLAHEQEGENEVESTPTVTH